MITSLFSGIFKCNSMPSNLYFLTISTTDSINILKIFFLYLKILKIFFLDLFKNNIKFYKFLIKLILVLNDLLFVDLIRSLLNLFKSKLFPPTVRMLINVFFGLFNLRYLLCKQNIYYYSNPFQNNIKYIIINFKTYIHIYIYLLYIINICINY